jgi:hypothetical protein
MTLADILGRGVSMEWYEGVALVRAVATCLIETSGDAPSIPELHHIEISTDGGVRITGGTIASEPVRRLGQLLQATLGHTDAPVQLRLVIVQATSPTRAFGSIREFDEALGYFERPGRAAVLRGLYVRAAAALPTPNSAQPPTLDAVAPLPGPDPAAIARPATAKSKPRAMKIAAVALAVITAAAAAWYAVGTRGKGEKRNVSAIARQASDAAGAAVLSGVSAITERTGLGRLVPDSGVTAERPETPDASASTQSKVRRSPRAMTAPETPILALDLDALPDQLVPSIGDQASAPNDIAAKPDPYDEGPLFSSDEGPVFSSDSADVLPPVGVRPQLPRDLPRNIRREQLSRIELIVSETGTVESVKLMGTPRTVHDFMILSAVKAWQFHPALKDGRPVRFRKIVWFVSR